MDTISLAEIFRLPAAERLRIAAAIWDSVASQPDQLVLTLEQDRELDARRADWLEHPHDSVDRATAKQRIPTTR
jgi:putative addiction module component (TIGR02574 family)